MSPQSQLYDNLRVVLHGVGWLYVVTAAVAGGSLLLRDLARIRRFRQDPSSHPRSPDLVTVQEVRVFGGFGLRGRTDFS